MEGNLISMKREGERNEALISPSWQPSCHRKGEWNREEWAIRRIIVKREWRNHEEHLQGDEKVGQESGGLCDQLEHTICDSNIIVALEELVSSEEHITIPGFSS